MGDKKGTEHSDLLQELLDKQALLELVTRYCRAVDRCDFDLLLSCYHPEAVDDHATFVGRPEDMFPPILERMRLLPPTQHIISNATFEIRGDVALGEIYTGVRTSDATGDYKHGGFGRSLDRYERRDGAWRIAHRQVIIEWFDPGPDRERPTIDVSKKSREDPSYSREWS
jgi:ketosteroid isomerase-like protein